MTRPLYGADLARIHHQGFGAFARGAAPAIVDLIHRAGFRSGRVVDLGCGSGILAAELSRAGFDVLGIDASPDMIDLARLEAPAASLVVGSLHEAEIPPAVAVTAIGEAIAYHQGDPPDVEALFLRVHRALCPGGIFLFDVVLGSLGAPMRYTGSHHGTEWTVDVLVEERPESALLTRHIRTVVRYGEEERVSEEVHQLRTFSREEIEAPLLALGFELEVLDHYGTTRLAAQRLAWVARKP